MTVGKSIVAVVDDESCGSISRSDVDHPFFKSHASRATASTAERMHGYIVCRGHRFKKKETPMRMLVILLLATLPFTVSAQEQTESKSGLVLSEADCAAAWKKAGGADLDSDKARPFIKSFEQVDVDHNGAVNWEEFKAGCKSGLVSG